jgi:agmatinase
MNEELNEELFLPQAIFTGTQSPNRDPDKDAVVILPVPYDGTTEWRPGTRDGPRAIIHTSQFLELYDLELKKETYRVGIRTLPELAPVMSGPEAMVNRVQTVAANFVGQGKLVIMLGGEHSLTVGTVRAFKARYPALSVLQLDAHTDLRDEYLGTGYNHACVMRRVSEICPIVQVGVRSSSLEEQQFMSQKGLKPFYVSGKTHHLPVDEIIAGLTEDVYVTIDLDVFDPSLMSAVGTPEPEGLDWHEITTLLKEVSQRRHIVGFDVMELSPTEGPAACVYMAAKLIYRFIGYITREN